MAYDSQVPSDPKVLRHHRRHVRVHVEEPCEVVQSEDLKMADQTEQNAYQKNHRDTVQPGAQFQYTRHRIAHVHVTQKWDL